MGHKEEEIGESPESRSPAPTEAAAGPLPAVFIDPHAEEGVKGVRRGLRVMFLRPAHTHKCQGPLGGQGRSRKEMFREWPPGLPFLGGSEAL